jgi:hypothetical protein
MNGFIGELLAIEGFERLGYLLPYDAAQGLCAGFRPPQRDRHRSDVLVSRVKARVAPRSNFSAELRELPFGLELATHVHGSTRLQRKRPSASSYLYLLRPPLMPAVPLLLDQEKCPPFNRVPLRPSLGRNPASINQRILPLSTRSAGYANLSSTCAAESL